VDLIQREYGGKVVPFDAVISVGTTPIQLVKANPQRTGLLIQNIGSYNVYISRSSNVSAGNGLLLMANGGSIIMHWREDGYMVLDTWYAVGSGSTTLYIQELILIK
jgi:hypothetical protein